MRLHRMRALLCAATAVPTIACGDRAGEKASVAETGGTAVIALASDLDMANSLVTAERFTQEVNRYMLFLPLIQYDSTLGYEGALARSFEMLGDTGVVFHLRRDVRWHDGVPTTAHDVAFTFERARDARTAFPNADWLIGWGPAHVVDSFTVRFALEPIQDPLAGVALFPIMPKHRLDSIAPEAMRQTAFNKNPIGNGPFRFVEYRANDRWVFEANPDFPDELGGRPYLDRIVIRVIPDQAARHTELETGNIHLLISSRAEDFTKLDADPRFVGLARPSRNYAFIPWNAKRPPLNDPRVRRALTMAMDRNEIIQVLRAGRGEIAAGPIGNESWAFDRSIAPLPFSPDSARALLDAAGIRDTNGDGIREFPAGKAWDLELQLPSGSPFNRDMAEMIRADLAEVGVRLVPRAIDFSAMIGNLTSPERKFDGALMGWENDIRINLKDLFHSTAIGSPYQFASYENPAVDSVIDAAARTIDREAARPLYSDIQRLIRDDQPWTFLYYYSDLNTASEQLQGVRMDVRGTFVNAGKWWLRQQPR